MAASEDDAARKNCPGATPIEGGEEEAADDPLDDDPRQLFGPDEERPASSSARLPLFSSATAARGVVVVAVAPVAHFDVDAPAVRASGHDGERAEVVGHGQLCGGLVLQGAVRHTCRTCWEPCPHPLVICGDTRRSLSVPSGFMLVQLLRRLRTISG